jgi:hypothetical protein
VARRFLPASLRSQLALAIALITALVLGLSFLAVYRGTGSRLQDRIDADLATQASEWARFRDRRDLSTPPRVAQAARSFIGRHPGEQPAADPRA